GLRRRYGEGPEIRVRPLFRAQPETLVPVDAAYAVEERGDGIPGFRPVVLRQEKTRVRAAARGTSASFQAIRCRRNRRDQRPDAAQAESAAISSAAFIRRLRGI